MKASYILCALALQVASIMAAPAEESAELSMDCPQRRDLFLSGYKGLQATTVRSQLLTSSQTHSNASDALPPANAIAAHGELVVASTTGAGAIAPAVKSNLRDVCTDVRVQTGPAFRAFCPLFLILLSNHCTTLILFRRL
ncbi:predicted protein [Uncinocarpus reesii 1704]|uniref:Uncharacterized protein n=1 Tax=Uncinocarpus reesii (strain UAMH 1704) TaxID=336963 RepID=C4JRM1_UNCRE|nr:uncharacterized protein UREG_05110 [Uncinocarpus reesii 1704]EEP80268.1 predicted protein [Uncinocarpus reesii 1704]